MANVRRICQKIFLNMNDSSLFIVLKDKMKLTDSSTLYFLCGIIVSFSIILPLLTSLTFKTGFQNVFNFSTNVGNEADSLSPDKALLLKSRIETGLMSPGKLASVKRDIVPINPELVKEALAALTRARTLVAQGKLEKAAKVYEHAYSLAATHPEVLIEYGEFMEKHHNDFVTAEHLYCKALTYNPEHSRALANRERTLPLVEEIDQSHFNRLDNMRDALLQVSSNHPGVRRMHKEMYYQHIHHTTALEGNTFTLNEARALVETRLAIGGKSILEHNEILGMEAALAYINGSLVRSVGSLTMDSIKEIHRRVMGYVDPIEAGRFRTTQVFVGDYVPPAAVHVQEMMEEFMSWLNTESTQMHPIELAALAHYRLVYIHPFWDGNGRTSRLLMNLILMQAGYPPVIIRKQDKHEYYKHLETANDGDVRPFIRFIARSTERTLNEYRWATVDGSIRIPELDGLNSHGIREKSDDDGRTIILEDLYDEGHLP